MSDHDTTFSAGETKLLTSILRNCDGQINVRSLDSTIIPFTDVYTQSNWDRVADEMGYKDANIARTRWGQIKKKKILGDGSAAPSPTKVTKPKASPKKKGGKKDSKDQVDSGNEEELGEGVADDKESVKKGKVEVNVKEEVVEED